MLCGSAFFIALAVVLGQRMSVDAVGVVVGIVFGVFASIPSSLILVAAMRRASASAPREAASPSYPQPPVIVVNPGGQQPQSWQQSPALMMPQPGLSERRWRVVGDDEIDELLNSGSRQRYV